MVQNRLLNSHQFLQHELMINRQLRVSIRKVLDLLLLRYDLLVQKIDLLCRNGVVGVLSLLSRRRRLSSNVIKRLLAVRSEFRVFELPCLYVVRFRSA